MKAAAEAWDRAVSRAGECAASRKRARRHNRIRPHACRLVLARPGYAEALRGVALGESGRSSVE